MDLRKLKSQKGLTGVDVVIALSIISVTTIAILAIYVNVISNSKKATRASAASRIATSILSNIDYMYYAEVEKELHTIRDNAGVTASDFNFTAHVVGDSAFNTKISSGYNVYIDSTEINTNRPGGTVNITEGDVGNCPLVLQIKVKVTYEVSGVEESVSLKTIKKREILDYCNEPDMSWLLGKSINGTAVKSLNQIQPIKWSVDVDNYIRTNSTDDWYSYITGNWAKVAITTDNKNFDPATGAIDKSKIIDGSIPVFMWIPRAGYSSENGSLAFVYSTSNNAIHSLTLYIGDYYSRQFIYNGIAKYDKTSRKIIDLVPVNVNSKIFKKKENGVWVKINAGSSGNELKIAGDTTTVNKTRELINELNNSQYGPIKNHLGKTYY